jgi:hypothetical protein
MRIIEFIAKIAFSTIPLDVKFQYHSSFFSSCDLSDQQVQIVLQASMDKSGVFAREEKLKL